MAAAASAGLSVPQKPSGAIRTRTRTG